MKSWFHFFDVTNRLLVLKVSLSGWNQNYEGEGGQKSPTMCIRNIWMVPSKGNENKSMTKFEIRNVGFNNWGEISYLPVHNSKVQLKNYWLMIFRILKIRISIFIQVLGVHREGLHRVQHLPLHLITEIVKMFQVKPQYLLK